MPVHDPLVPACVPARCLSRCPPSCRKLTTPRSRSPLSLALARRFGLAGVRSSADRGGWGQEGATDRRSETRGRRSGRRHVPLIRRTARRAHARPAAELNLGGAGPWGSRLRPESEKGGKVGGERWVTQSKTKGSKEARTCTRVQASQRVNVERGGRDFRASTEQKQVVSVHFQRRRRSPNYRPRVQPCPSNHQPSRLVLSVPLPCTPVPALDEVGRTGPVVRGARAVGEGVGAAERPGSASKEGEEEGAE